MGMVMCTFVGCPIGSCIGCGVAACQNPRTHRCLKLALLGTIFAAGLICYVILNVLCARADEHSEFTHECWSEGGSMPYMEFGQWTGILRGIGFFGTLLLWIRMHYGDTHQNPNQDSLEPITSSSAPEQTETSDADVEHGRYHKMDDHIETN